MDAPPWILGGSDPYRAFTDACNASASAPPTVILSSGQACVWYRLTIASKDGDWLIREDPAACAVVLAQLERLGARYRPGAPLDTRWLAAGWSSHFEAITADGLRLRFDFVSRPPRLSADAVAALWRRIGGGGHPAVVSISELIALKRTMRLKDYAFIGGLSQLMDDPAEQARTTLDAESLLALLARHPDLEALLERERPLCASATRTVAGLAAAIDAEIRQHRAVDEARIKAYTAAMQPWLAQFRSQENAGETLAAAHGRLCVAAERLLPMQTPWP